ncbi:hypothetical protein [Algoriphagus boritolerans]|uniref:Natural product n=1 Tax=Algoriphagus boritolerans DSM 17298 = JCM 18970 TaxID=1120964 RepID=A0A1H5YG71_9BACT|nr:hypothetical protein [Algoriphagus boritolerans]SEG23071.1 hypothetical protein SAMN03080598_02983 [Algoriphagus boritolerans DSM 17298 = JCM 18970]
MKKLSLEMLRLSTNEILERSQMKKITGGYGGGAGCLDMKCGSKHPNNVCCAQTSCSDLTSGFCRVN